MARRQSIMDTYKELMAVKNTSYATMIKPAVTKLYWVATDPITGIMKVSCDFHDILGHGLDNIHEIWSHSSEAARLEYNALR